MYSLFVNSSSEKPQRVTKFSRSASNNVRPKVMNRSPTLRSRQFQPSPNCFTAGPNSLVSVRVGRCALAQDVGSAAVGAFDAPLVAEVEVDFGMTQRAAAAVTGNAVGIDGDGFERLGHDLSPVTLSPVTPAHDSRRPGLRHGAGHSRRL